MRYTLPGTYCDKHTGAHAHRAHHQPSTTVVMGNALRVPTGQRGGGLCLTGMCVFTPAEVYQVYANAAVDGRIDPFCYMKKHVTGTEYRILVHSNRE